MISKTLSEGVLIPITLVASAFVAGGVTNDNIVVRDNSSSEKSEVGARILPVAHPALFGSHRWATYRDERDSTESDLRMSFRGPVFGAELRF